MSSRRLALRSESTPARLRQLRGTCRQRGQLEGPVHRMGVWIVALHRIAHPVYLSARLLDDLAGAACRYEELRSELSQGHAPGSRIQDGALLLGDSSKRYRAFEGGV